MTITYGNGQKIQAAVVVRDEVWMRVVLAGSDDVTEFTLVNGAWVSEDCEPVHVEFGPARLVYREDKEENFVCSHELASKLIHMLLNPEEETVQASAPVQSLEKMPAARLVV